MHHLHILNEKGLQNQEQPCKKKEQGSPSYYYLLMLSHGLNAGEGCMAVLARHDCLSRKRAAQRGNLAAGRQLALWVAAAT